MHKKLFLLPALLFAALALLIPACRKPLDREFSTPNETEGFQNFDPGFVEDSDIAPSSELMPPVKIKGTWLVIEPCSIIPYLMSIVNGTEVASIELHNFWDAFINPVHATIHGNTITIPRQEPDGDEYYVEGTGTIDISATPDKLTIDYKVSSEQGPIEVSICNSILTKY